MSASQLPAAGWQDCASVRHVRVEPSRLDRLLKPLHRWVWADPRRRARKLLRFREGARLEAKALRSPEILFEVVVEPDARRPEPAKAVLLGRERFAKTYDR